MPNSNYQQKQQIPTIDSYTCNDDNDDKEPDVESNFNMSLILILQRLGSPLITGSSMT